MTDSAVIETIWDEIDNAAGIIVCGHVQPDGDSVGCVTALTLYLKEQGKEKVTGFLPDPIPERYSFLPGSETITTRLEDLSSCDLVIAIDCSDRERFQPLSVLMGATKVINIDHHRTNAGFGTINWINASAAAAGEMVLKLLSAREAVLSRNVATALYLAITTDSGSFRFSNTTPETLRAAARLLEMGVDGASLSEQVFDNRSLSATRLLGAALSNLQLELEGKVAWLWVDQHMLRECGASDEELEGIVNYAGNIKGVEVGVLFRQLHEGIRVAFRSRGKVDVSALAAELGGGGHSRASGCLLNMDRDQARREILQRIRAALAGD